MDGVYVRLIHKRFRSGGSSAKRAVCNNRCRRVATSRRRSLTSSVGPRSNTSATTSSSTQPAICAQQCSGACGAGASGAGAEACAPCAPCSCWLMWAAADSPIGSAEAKLCMDIRPRMTDKLSKHSARARRHEAAGFPVRWLLDVLCIAATLSTVFVKILSFSIGVCRRDPYSSARVATNAPEIILTMQYPSTDTSSMVTSCVIFPEI